MPKESPKSPESDEEIILDIRVSPCGCKLQLWAAGGDLHMGPCCEDCEKMLLEEIERAYGRKFPIVYEH